jgi:hypothetical protein
MHTSLLVFTFLSGVAVAQDAPSLEIVGTCPGDHELILEGLEPDGRYALLRGTALGSSLIPAGPCAGAPFPLAGAGAALQRVGPSGSGSVVLPAYMPASACEAYITVLDLETCLTTEGLMVGGTVDEWTGEFPSEDSMYHTGGLLGSGGGGAYFVAGNYLEESFAGTGMSDLTGMTLEFAMSDFTNSACTVGLLTWDVTVNGVGVGTYGYEGGSMWERIEFFESYLFAPIGGEGPSGDEYNIRLEANETVCPGGGSWNWFPGGTIQLRR